MANIAGACGRVRRLRRCWRAPADQTAFADRCTAERGLCGGFNSHIARWRATMPQADRDGKNVKILCVGKKGQMSCGANSMTSSLLAVDLREVNGCRSTTPDIAHQVLAMFRWRV